MRRAGVLLIALLVVLAVVSQLVLPSLLAGRVADRLERNGGSAHVSLHAFPSARLLFGEGDSLRVEGKRLRLELRGRGQVLDKVDGFDRVRVRLRRVTAPPLDIRSFALTRQSDDRDYSVRLDGTTSPRQVARFLGSRAGGALGGFLGDLAAGTLPSGGQGRIPVRADATFRSRGGRREVTSAHGSVAGIPAGPLVDLVVDAVVREL